MVEAPPAGGNADRWCKCGARAPGPLGCSRAGGAPAGRQSSAYGSRSTTRAARPASCARCLGRAITSRDWRFDQSANPAARRSPLRESVRPGGWLRGVPFPALKAFLQGEAAFAHDSWALAQRYYETCARSRSRLRASRMASGEREALAPALPRARTGRHLPDGMPRVSGRVIGGSSRPCWSRISSGASSGSRTRSGVAPRRRLRAPAPGRGAVPPRPLAGPGDE